MRLHCTFLKAAELGIDFGNQCHILSGDPDSLEISMQHLQCGYPSVCHTAMLTADFLLPCSPLSQDRYGNVHPSEAAHHVSPHSIKSYRRERAPDCRLQQSHSHSGGQSQGPGYSEALTITLSPVNTEGPL